MRLDWAGARARLERIQQSIERLDSRTPEELARIYQERAQRLAQPPALETSAEEELLIFRAGGERYAFRVADVSEVLRECRVTPVPGAPRVVAGVIQVRGEIRPVYDLRRKLGLPEMEGETGAVILMRGNGHPFGARVDAIEEIRVVREDTRRLPGQAGHFAWMTEDLIGVLKAELLGTKES